MTRHRACKHPPMTEIRKILDLEQFPLDQPGSAAWRALVARCQADLTAHGMFNLTGFLRAEIAADVAAQFSPMFETDAFRHIRSHNIYFRRDIEGLDPNHPALTEFETSNQTLCADQFADGSLVAIYEWPEFATFLATVMDKPVLYTMSDPLARVNAMSYRTGQALNWHFDRSEFTTTLLLQAPEKGGAFEYRTGLRSAEDPNYDGVAAMLRGEDDQVQRLTLTPGTLNVFKGRNTAHRVTPVEGHKERMIAVFSFYEAPGVAFSDQERIGFYGRAR